MLFKIPYNNNYLKKNVYLEMYLKKLNFIILKPFNHQFFLNYESVIILELYEFVIGSS